MDMDIDHMAGLTDNEKGKLKIIQHELQELHSQDMSDLSDNADERHKVEDN